ncbi:MAG TPA: TonB family protein [Gemmatimonadaceae bacterium]|nr:TonB family protein [Gemmatimonadaceae bacterium]
MRTGVSSALHKILPALATLLIAGGLAAPRADAQALRGVVKGVVRDSVGAPVGYVEVSVVGSENRTLTDSTGRFHLSDVAFGKVELRARRLGYIPSVSTIVFPAGSTADVELRLSPAPDYLPVVEVHEPRQVFDARLSGFKERSSKGVGHFITRDKLEHLQSYRFIDVMRSVPGVRMRTLRGGGSTITLRGASCPPLVFVDGFAASAGVVDLDMFDLSTVEGIEIYSGLASIPPQFVTGRGGERCGVVAIWSRPYRPKARPAVAANSRSRELDSLVSSMSVFTLDQVDTPAALVPGTASPVYPDSLRQEGVPGRVVVELVVNVDGTLDSESVILVSSTHPLFTNAVQQALATAKFRVATLRSRPVRQLLQLPFVFRLENAASNR